MNGSDMDVVLVLGAFGAMLGGFWAILKQVLKQSLVDREAERLERKELTSALQLVATSSQEVATATKQAAIEAKQRNGHLAELVMQSQENNQKLADRNLEIYKSSKG